MGFPGSSAGKESPCNAGDPSSIPGLRRSPQRWDRLPALVFLCFPGGPDGKEYACNVGDLGSIPGLGRFPGGGHGSHSSILPLTDKWMKKFWYIYTKWNVTQP